MPSYSKNSLKQLDTAHPDLKVIFTEVIKKFDNTILYGSRTPAYQLELFKKGRSFIDGKWVITDKSKVVTYKDGTIEKSTHNYNPSHAVDVVPYPIDFKGAKRMYYFAGWVMSIADQLLEEGKITHKVRWGGNWDGDGDFNDQTFFDLLHFEIVN